MKHTFENTKLYVYSVIQIINLFHELYVCGLWLIYSANKISKLNNLACVANVSLKN